MRYETNVQDIDAGKRSITVTIHERRGGDGQKCGEEG